MLEFLKDFLFPKRCVGCGAFGSFICHKCRNKLVLLEKQRCFYCRRASLHGLTHPGCRKTNGVDGAISVYVYNPFLKRLIKTVKYRLAREALDELLTLSIQQVGHLLYSSGSPYKTVPLESVPLHKSKMRSRGFNQADLIVRYLQKLHPQTKIIQTLSRDRNTKAQAQLSSKQSRYINMIGAFSVKSKPPEMLLLVDDVITTGSTIRSAVEALKRAGAQKVYVFSLARG